VCVASETLSKKPYYSTVKTNLTSVGGIVGTVLLLLLPPLIQFSELPFFLFKKQKEPWKGHHLGAQLVALQEMCVQATNGMKQRDS
jgi:hypothetical protein